MCLDCLACAGHLDGCVCLWDVRQARSGGSGLLTESRLFTQIVGGVSRECVGGTLWRWWWLMIGVIAMWGVQLCTDLHVPSFHQPLVCCDLLVTA